MTTRYPPVAISRRQNFQLLGYRKFRNVTGAIPSLVIYTELNVLDQTSIEKSTTSRRSTEELIILFAMSTDRNSHPTCNVYEGTCVCGSSYIGETKRNVEQRWKEHHPPL